MRNVIDAICEIVTSPKYKLEEYSIGRNRANSMGCALEEYVKDIFAGTLGETNETIRLKMLGLTFSYLGNQNNPPDSILMNGDAIEVKKIESNDSSLALNSSYPKAKLYVDSPMISEACKKCEDWTVKDMIYVVGVVKNSFLSSLCFVYGDDYCANKLIYERVKTTIKNGVESIPDVEFAETKELGRVNRVDPLGITNLRVRGMWGIENPFKVFKYVYSRDYSKQFNFMAIINKSKYDSFQNTAKIETLSKINKNLTIKEISIKNPNNPVQLIDAVLISYYV